MSSAYSTDASPTTVERIGISINQSILTVHTFPQLGVLGETTGASYPRPDIQLCLAMDPSPLELLAASIVCRNMQANSRGASGIILGDAVAWQRAEKPAGQTITPTDKAIFTKVSAAAASPVIEVATTVCDDAWDSVLGTHLVVDEMEPAGLELNFASIG